MRSLIALTLLLSLFHSSYSQDIIYTVSNGKIECTVHEVSSSTIVYVLNSDTAHVAINRRDVILIQYENGTHDLMRAKANSRNPNFDYLAKPNGLSYNMADILIQRFQLVYQRTTAKGKVGYSIPLIGGVTSGEGALYSGIDINFYPLGHKKNTYFLGPKIRVGYDEIIFDDAVVALLVNNGVMLNTPRSLFFTLSGALGILHMWEQEQLIGFGTLSLLVGIRF